MFCRVRGNAPVGGVKRFSQIAGEELPMPLKYPSARSGVPSSNWKMAGTLSGIANGRVFPTELAACEWRLAAAVPAGFAGALRARVSLPAGLVAPMSSCSGWQGGVIVGILVGVAVGGVLLGVGVTRMVLQDVAPRIARLY